MTGLTKSSVKLSKTVFPAGLPLGRILGASRLHTQQQGFSLLKAKSPAALPRHAQDSDFEILNVGAAWWGLSVPHNEILQRGGQIIQYSLKMIRIRHKYPRCDFMDPYASTALPSFFSGHRLFFSASCPLLTVCFAVLLPRFYILSIIILYYPAVVVSD